MSSINDRVAYLKGLAEGMKLSDETNEGKMPTTMTKTKKTKTGMKTIRWSYTSARTAETK